jgi:hypothetical protein
MGELPGIAEMPILSEVEFLIGFEKGDIVSVSSSGKFVV